MQRLLISLAAAALATATVAVPASAAERHTVQVDTSGLDLSTEAGAAALDARLERAARAVCAPDARVLRDLARAATCRTEALANARGRAGTMIASARQNRTRAAA